MGLFGGDKKKLEEALEGLLGNIGANWRFHEGVAASQSVQERLSKLTEIATRMREKGKADELESVLDVWSEKRPLASVLFRGSTAGVKEELDRQDDLWADVGRDLPPIAGSGPKAEAEEERRAEIAKLRAADEYWKSALETLRA